MRPRTLAFLVCAGLSGCMVGPDYRAPDPVLPDRWQAARDPANALKPVAANTLQTWWKTFNDPALNRLMDRARQGNLDLKMAFTRIEQSRAERRANRADLFPRVGGAAAGAYLDNLIPGQTQDGNAFGLFLTGFDAIWEIDVFGRLRRRLEAATDITESATEDYRQAWVILSAELAREYTDYRNLQLQGRITAANLASQRQTLGLTEQLFREGVGNRYDVSRARAQTETTAARLPRLESQLTAVQHRLELLIGTKPGALQMTLATPGAVPAASSRELLTTPADTLRLRPDIRRAERDLAAATATQGAAIAELFPKISVAAFIGVQNSDLETLFRSSSFSWASGSAIMQPIFNFGRIRAGIDLADARQKEAYLKYERTVLDALRETETAMTEFLKEEQRRQQLSRSVSDLQEALRLAELRYREGVSTFLDVLDAERVQYLEELELAQSQAQTTLYLIALYKALGGAGQLEVKPAEEPLRPWG
jgi:NodT family efflux transporter outer membrane factor (OMF) lipoprotein